MVPPTEPGDEWRCDDEASKQSFPDEESENDDDTARIGSGFKRRSLLKMAGLAVGGSIFSVADVRAANKSAVEVTQKDGYELWRVPEDEIVVIELGDGDTIENVLIDQTAPGANLYIKAPYNPVDWKIRNVGWRGVGYVSDWASDTYGWTGVFMMTVSGNGLIENVFIDNRSADGTPTELGGGFTPRHHSGVIEVRNTFIAGCGNNAFYADNSGYEGGGEGDTKFYNCYHRDNTVSQYRIGSPDSLVENCIGIVHDPDGTRGVYPNTTSRRSRGVWSRTGQGNNIRNSVMYVSPDDVNPVSPYNVTSFDQTMDGVTEMIFDGAYGNADAPDGLVLEQEQAGSVVTTGWPQSDGLTQDVLGDGGVPTSPEMAARGDRVIPDIPELDGSSSTTQDKRLTIEGTGTRADYTFEVSGELNPTDTVNDSDTIDGSTGSGYVVGGSDDFLFTGDLVSIQLDGDATVLIDGTEIDVSQYSQDKRLTIEGTGTRADYTFEVGGELNPTDTVNDSDTIDGSTGSGYVVGGSDDFLFTGDLVSIQLDGDAAVLIDGTEIDVSNYTSESVPTIDRYEVAELGSKNPHADITVECDVSDANGNLSSLTVEVADSSGIVDSSEHSLSGENAYLTDYFKIKNVDGKTFDVTATVADAAGNQTSRSATVTE